MPVRLASFSLVAALFISLSGTIPKAADAATEQRRFVAWQDGEPTLRVEGRRNGSCDSSSYKSSRKDAWRCTAGNYLFDPCFENLAELQFGELLCVGTPWARSGWIMFSALDYDQHRPFPTAPWGLTLTSGARCLFLSGASSVVRGRRLNYARRLRRPRRPCLCLFGRPDRARPTWRIFGGGVGGRNWHTERIRVAWR